jgi:hypothetical protein
MQSSVGSHHLGGYPRYAGHALGEGEQRLALGRGAGEMANLCGAECRDNLTFALHFYDTSAPVVSIVFRIRAPAYFCIGKLRRSNSHFC